MSKHKHTPGPWVMDTIPTSVGICHRIGPFPPRRPDDETVRHACLYADYPSGFNPADRELEANARLMTAAPELLEALQACIQQITALCSADDVPDQARAAIAKATA
ncbi:hypothetical protein [Pseudomonas aeruginosa]|uniref:hypothetical protein n=1 Tax=Pseudomonas aeruginosa TaxID=287 RepID=UPI0015CD8177|nr:hypothetical protein [Pseudomonas aeruginosa]